MREHVKGMHSAVLLKENTGSLDRREWRIGILIKNNASAEMFVI